MIPLEQFAHIRIVIDIGIERADNNGDRNASSKRPGLHSICRSEPIRVSVASLRTMSDERDRHAATCLLGGTVAYAYRARGRLRRSRHNIHRLQLGRLNVG